MNFSYNKKKYNSFQEKIEILSVTSYFFIIISKCYYWPNLKNLVKGLIILMKLIFLDICKLFSFLVGQSSPMVFNLWAIAQ